MPPRGVTQRGNRFFGPGLPQGGIDRAGLNKPGFQARLREATLGQQGEQLIGEATEGLRDFDPADFFSPEALGALFEQAGLSFDRRLSGLQATQAKRGIRGPIAGAIEGDLASAFQRDLLGTTAQFAGQRAGLTLGRLDRLGSIGGAARGQSLNLLARRLDEATAKRQAEKQKRGALFGLLGTGLGAAAGAAFGQPGIGAQLGQGLGRSVA